MTFSIPNPSIHDPSRVFDPSILPIRMVAIDLDGTLLRSNKALSKRTARAVFRAANQGVRVVLASARPPRSMRVVYSYLGLDTLQINYNGAMIYDQVKMRSVFHQPLEPALAKRVVQLARRIDPGVVVSVEILDRWYTDHVDESLPTETSKEFAPDVIGDLRAFLESPVTKLMFLAHPPRLGRIRDYILESLGPFITLTTSDEHMIQVLHPRVDKAAALAIIAKHYKIPRHEIMAIGDAPNDLGMIRWAGVGVAMKNAWPQTLRIANVVVPSNDEDGVAYALEHYVLKPSPDVIRPYIETKPKT